MDVTKSMSHKLQGYQLKAPRLKGHLRSSSVGVHLNDRQLNKSPKMGLGSEKSPQNISFETEVNREFKSIAKLPIEMIIKPKVNRLWVNKKAEENKSNNQKLKIRFKNYLSPKKRANHSHSDSNEKLFEFIKHIKEKPDEANPRNFIKLFNQQDPLVGRFVPTEKRIRTPLPLRPQFAQYGRRTGSLVNSSEDLHGKMNISNVFEDKRFHLASRATVGRDLRSPDRSRNNSPNHTQNNFAHSLFQGRLEPSFPEIPVKYTESAIEPEIKVTKSDVAFVGKAFSPMKTKLKMNMNKVILSDSNHQSQDSLLDNVENYRVTNTRANTTQTSGFGGFMISPEKIKQPRTGSVSRSFRNSSPNSTSMSPEKPKVTQQRFKDHMGGGFSASQADIKEQKNSLLAKIDSSQFILPGNAYPKALRKISIE